MKRPAREHVKRSRQVCRRLLARRKDSLSGRILAEGCGGAENAWPVSPSDTQVSGERADTPGDVVADQPHAFDAVDAALGGFDSVP